MPGAVRSQRLTILALATAASFSLSLPAAALSPPDLVPVETEGAPDRPLPGVTTNTLLPQPGLASEPGEADEQALEAPPATGDTEPGNDGTVEPDAAPEAGTDAAPVEAPATETAPAQIIRDLSTLPEPVRQMRERLVEAAASGEIERLRPLIEGTPKPPQIMNGESSDPVETLKSFSGDPDGQEILAIMLDILSTGAARIDAGAADEVYVWPYFAGKPLDSLTPPERVELLRIVTAGDLLGMEENNNYNFYRIGITPDGQWRFMTGGD